MRKVLITGIGSGFGKAIKDQFISKKYIVDALTKSKIKNSFNVNSLQTNFLNLEDVRKKIKKLVNKKNKYEFAILNAGVLGKIELTKNVSIIDLEKAFKINLYANKIIIDEILNKGVKFKSIIVISSGAALKTKYGWYSYCATKASLKFLIDNYAMENQKKHFINYSPGIIETNMQKKIRGVDPKKIPSVKRFKKLYEDKKIITPNNAALNLYFNLKKILKCKSGSFLDARDLEK